MITNRGVRYCCQKLNFRNKRLKQSLRAMEAKSTGDLSSLVEEQRLQKTEGEEEEEEEEKPVLPATEPPKRKNFRTDMGSSAPPGRHC